MPRQTKKQKLFFPPKNNKLAKIIKLNTPKNARESVKVLKKGGLTKKERQALVLAANRADAQQKRKNLSSRERKEFRQVERILRDGARSSDRVR